VSSFASSFVALSITVGSCHEWAFFDFRGRERRVWGVVLRGIVCLLSRPFSMQHSIHHTLVRNTQTTKVMICTEILGCDWRDHVGGFRSAKDQTLIQWQVAAGCLRQHSGLGNCEGEMELVEVVCVEVVCADVGCNTSESLEKGCASCGVVE